ncbi:NADP-dependent 3-hydroxy acid dehydrogenase YdfG [Sphingobium faniae]|nr:NADP-dependent 3-hydroxy acid dehydrogenase YdfG [Sphingobium faniae]
MSIHVGRAIIVTGGSSGIGRELAIQLAPTGAALMLIGRSQAELEATSAMVVSAGGVEPSLFPVDIAEPGTMQRVVEEVAQKHSYLYGLVNCAGVMFPEPILNARPARWRAMFDINVLAVLEGCQTAVRVMRSHGQDAHILNVSSLAVTFQQGSVYAASKAALEMIHQTLRSELERDKIRASLVTPGLFATNLGRDLEPQTFEVIAKCAAAKGLDFAQPDMSFAGDPKQVAKAMAWILESDSTINIDRIVIRPPINLEY